MKIGIVCYPTFGGSGVVATELGKALAQRGNEVHFITYSQPIRLDFFNENIFYHEVNISNYPLFEYPPYESALAGKMVDVVKYAKLDILHVHYAIPHATSAFLAKQILKLEGINIPVITTLHGTDISIVGRDPALSPIVTFGINNSDGVTAVSEDLKKDTFKSFKITNEIEVIYNFVDLTRFYKQKKDHFKSLICPNNEKLLVHASNFRKVKRVEDIIRAFAKIRLEVPSKLLMVGDGEERQKMEELCRKLDLCEDVRFIGKLDAIEEVLSVADLFLMPSEKESFGLAALEAMACEVPVISSNIGGLAELNIHGETGFLSNVGDIDDMVKNAIFVLKDENLPIFKKNALQRAKLFDLNLIVPKYESFYKTIMKKMAK
ncbi:MAG: N-acetyl-alpha-D-glucosaminyl L-malate synthase BshA [Cytophagaceae bacterium]|nr:N-acetyl-alpha-D-glucosaminyl L-malate synthase BshA [Cytophagaceae bacterium]MBK9509666.1 N-acetyl-alpha-D-glucosaminyl L-malate synthase BshA [Cytophagaceae bacterium]MBK9936244.1 N-acetyl-alpha-D-glucosaminyl L-malate synthase BshA [Cytophagaceae bacterium]MBL0303863.1 N-acetyl-alpha-D-glucosaminyl L-malate synthase BshA [Cytophagaceae bacterium]MBL0326679.1 N-acetyl-alpha-D-glucosaminyl L-malate synthase BshA [Cytophagaceae bacterium]